jgi:CTP synthase
VAAKKNTKYIFVVGGVLSGLGKGITAASIGNILKSRGLSVNIQKLDPYLNVDAGTLNPAEHGECFVTKDGAETDLDLGHYERFLDEELTQSSSVMSGRILSKVIEGERQGAYLGKTVQIIPHVTEAIQSEVHKAAEGYDVHIVEIGGTVGDYEGLAFIEAIREFQGRVGAKNTCLVHVVYLPYLGASKEIKTKPAQNAARDLRSLGLVPDVTVARSEFPVPNPEAVVRKLSMSSGVPQEAIALLPNADSVYEVPITLETYGIGDYVTKSLGLKSKRPNNKQWVSVVEAAKKEHSKRVKVGVVAKYLDNEDTYMSVFEALKAAAMKHNIGVDIQWIDAEKLADGVGNSLRGMDGILVPGGFGERGIEGKINAARYAIKKKVPYLGLCLGMQVAAVATAREAGLSKAHTIEVDPDTPDPIIHIMEGQDELWGTGGTMRLGNYECVIDKSTKAYKLYGKKSVMERHRHRYELNNTYRAKLAEAGMIFAGLSPDKNLVELVEFKDHPFFMASQFHPEFKSRPGKPHPMFDGFIAELKKQIK